MRDLQQNTSAVAGVFFTAAGAAVIEVFQHRERLLDDLAGFLTFDIDDETDAASIVLEARVVKSLFCWQITVAHSSPLKLNVYPTDGRRYTPRKAIPGKYS